MHATDALAETHCPNFVYQVPGDQKRMVLYMNIIIIMLAIRQCVDTLLMIYAADNS